MPTLKHVLVACSVAVLLKYSNLQITSQSLTLVQSYVNGTQLYFADLNVTGFYYFLRGYIDNNGRPKWALGPYVDFVKGFILTMAEIDLDYLKPIVKSGVNGEPIEIDPMEALMKNKMIPILVIVGILLILSICTPLVGCCFCMCRLCGKCGGRLTLRNARKQSRCCGIVVFMVLTFCCIILLVGAGAIWTVGGVIPKVGDHVVNVATFTIDDLATFVKQLFQDLMQIAVNDVNFVTDKLIIHLQNMPDAIFGPFLNAPDTILKIGTLVNATDSTGTAVTSLSGVISIVQTLLTNIAAIDTTLTVELAAIRTDLDAITTACALPLDCTVIPNSNRVPNLDFSGIPDVTSHAALSTAASALPISTIKQTINASLSGMQTRVDDDTVSLRDESIAQLNTVATIVEPLLDQAEIAFDDVVLMLDDLKQLVSNTTDSVKPQLVNITYGFIGLSCLILVIILFDVIGIVLGIRNMTFEAAENRGRMGQIGSNFILASVGFSVIFIFFYLFYGAILMLVGSLMTMVCDPIRDLRIFSKIIDDPAVWDEDQYILGTKLLNKSYIPLTMKGIFDDCQMNKAAYTALKLKYRIDIENLVNIDDKLPDLNPMKETVRGILIQVILLDNTNKNNLQSFLDTYDSGFTADYSTDLDALDTQMTSFDMTDLITDIDTASATFPLPSGSTVANGLDGISARLDTLMTTTRIELQSNLTELRDNLESLPFILTSLKTSLETILDALPPLETHIHSDGVIIIGNAMDNFLEKIRLFANQTFTHVASRLANDMAKCGLLWDIYDGSTGIICVYFLDAFNGLWFSLVLIGIFLLANICFGVRMVKYIRCPVDAHKYRLDTEDSASSHYATRRVHR